MPVKSSRFAPVVPRTRDPGTVDRLDAGEPGGGADEDVAPARVDEDAVEAGAALDGVGLGLGAADDEGVVAAAAASAKSSPAPPSRVSATALPVRVSLPPRPSTPARPVTVVKPERSSTVGWRMVPRSARPPASRISTPEIPAVPFRTMSAVPSIRSVSVPASPAMVSAWASVPRTRMTSLPSPPLIESVPVPPSRVSLPPMPRSVSLPARPRMRSLLPAAGQRVGGRGAGQGQRLVATLDDDRRGVGDAGVDAVADRVGDRHGLGLADDEAAELGRVEGEDTRRRPA